MGSTKPLADHPADSINDFNDLTKVWIVGEDARAVTHPEGDNWVAKTQLKEYDDKTHKLVAAATYYEKAN